VDVVVYFPFFLLLKYSLTHSLSPSSSHTHTHTHPHSEQEKLLIEKAEEEGKVVKLRREAKKKAKEARKEVEEQLRLRTQAKAHT
jgi:hypothetical protein